MNMDVKKTMLSLARLVLPGMGFGLTCMGIYLVSLPNEPKYTWSIIPAYIMVVVGFLVTLVGVFWTICHSMKSKMYQRGGHQQHIHVYTIERPSSFPPSYEESQSSHVSLDTVPEFGVTVEGVDVVMSLAPPLYTQDSSEVPDCTWSWEQPPSYSQVEQVHAEEQREALSGH
ncbi:transmembrane protein 252-like [Thunnus albacares]|uniref:transmembrane protein 252-like n=1 Tax=Thunnus albacares TaxID=8236 RepID=UPI001CF6295D|nr:transmembrane protein 252-like [Thunnus albacares]XP_044230292.1 transmembrane protein 252-like [Thunnus albacares]XP_044230300.1 transmembrane protein 252-like [Thunnus albacares]